MTKKEASSIGAIGCTNVQNSVYTCGNTKLTLLQKIQEIKFQIRIAWFEKHVSNKSYTLDDVCRYITEIKGFKEVNKETEEYQEQYVQMRSSYIIQYAPELLGKYAERPQLNSLDEAGLKKFSEQIEIRQRLASNVSSDCFDIELHMYKKESANMKMSLFVELKYGEISGGVNGDNNYCEQFRKIYRDVYKYYGVTAEDIEHKSKRYHMLINTLACR